MSFYLMFTADGDGFRVFYCNFCDREYNGVAMSICPKTRQGACPSG
jgi:hypothetical protein